jgi:MoxR-like ATPase
MLKLILDYPNKKEEKEIMNRMAVTDYELQVQAVVESDEIIKAREVVNRIYIDEKVKDYILDIVFASRDPEQYGLDIKDYIQYGASPRATIYLTIAAKAYAFIKGRGYVTPQDVKTVGKDVLRHRVIVSYEAEAEDLTSEDIIRKIFDQVEVP